MQHMRDTHLVTLTDSRLRTVASRNARNKKPLFPTCPLCGEDDSTMESLEIHMADHLRYLALRSLPSYEEHLSEFVNIEDDGHYDGASDLQNGGRSEDILNEEDASEIGDDDYNDDSDLLIDEKKNNEKNFLGEKYDFNSHFQWSEILNETPTINEPTEIGLDKSGTRQSENPEGE